jgi:hypothetical protein
MLDLFPELTNQPIAHQPIVKLNSQLEQIRTWSEGLQVEICGLILNDGTVVQLPNSHPTPADAFRIDAESLTSYKRSQIRAIWHTHWSDSHPGHLTSDDCWMSHGPNKLPIALYHSGFQCWDYYEPLCSNPWPLNGRGTYGGEIDSYTGWPFVWGRADCFALIRCYLLGAIGKDIGEWKRPLLENFPHSEWSCTAWDRAANGLVEVDDRIRQHDILEIAQGGGREPNHLAIVISVTEGQVKILHNMGERYVSAADDYGGYWRARTVRRLRFGG